MKKVYLVSVSFSYESGLNYRVILQIFASKRKAQAYRDFKSLKVERDGVSACFPTFELSSNPIVSIGIRIEEHFICSLDWSDELKELKDEKFDATSIDEVKSDYQLTKKYNLLDFV